MNFKEWFEKKLLVGAFPSKLDLNEKYSDVDIIINMSDEFYFDYVMELQKTKSHFWFPMNEIKKDVGLNSIFGAMNVLYEAEKRNKKVLVHCHSGRNRSRTVLACYYYMRSGEHLKDGDEKYINRMYRNSVRGYLPPMREFETFLKRIHDCLKEDREFNNNSGGMLDVCKIDSIDNF